MGHRVPDWDEDGCLTLNVFCPVPALRDHARPVLVWFHGGGFTSGSGGWDWYDGARLAALGDMVVVTANYRVGPLGYLYLPDIGADNLGLQDQDAVLRWVRDNIAGFGGDPRNVTVGGQSAGAYSALALAVDEKTTGLATQVLLESGPWGVSPQDPQDAIETAEAYLRVLGVPGGPDAGKALRALPVDQLLSAYGQLATQLARPGNVAPPMYPVLGGAGLRRTWQQALADGALDGKALLIGTTRDEMTAFIGVDSGIGNLTGESAVANLTDALFRTGALQIANHHARRGNSTYIYQFDHVPTGDGHALGATHCSELPFLFGTFDAYPNSPMLGQPGAPERALGHRFASAVAEFITTGTVREWSPHTTGHVQHFA
jgi:para-nitrobenzyl esterase